MSRDDIPGLDPVSELEMWISCLGGYFRYHTFIFPAPLRVVSLEKDFCKELRTADRILQRIEELTRRLLSVEVAAAGNACLDEAGRQGDLPQDLSRYRSHTGAAGRLISRLESVNDFRAVIGGELETEPVPLVFFKSVGRLINRELRAFHRDPVMSWIRSKHVSHSWQGDVFANLPAAELPAGLRMETVALLERVYRVLGMVGYIVTELRNQFHYRVFLALFSYLHVEGKTVLRRLEQWLAHCELLRPERAEVVGPMLFALKMEMKRVFRRELAGIEEEGRLEQIYVRLEDSAGLLRNCYQNVFISLARSFNPALDVYKVFPDIAVRRQQSIHLHGDLCAIQQMVVRMCDAYSLVDVIELRETLRVFHDSSMQHLMFKDWAVFEGFIEQVGAASGELLTSVLHRFLVFLNMLIAAVENRAVLRDLVGREATGG